MIVLTATYPFIAGSRFDEDYYRNRHCALVKEIWGEQVGDITIYKGLPGLDGSDPAYRLQCHMDFRSIEDVGKAMANPRTSELMADIVNYTDLSGTLQVGER